MGDTLKKRIKQNADFGSPVEEAMLNVMVAADHLRTAMDRICAKFDITRAQYNVLRILRGIYPAGHARCDIASRMLENAPDVTRLIDRLEKTGLAERTRDVGDRRLSLTVITDKGLELLDEMKEDTEKFGSELSEILSQADAQNLSLICEKIYGDR